ncbi:MAG: FAD-dependent oxidoreductase [Candidatus Omnitrophica bacterium]|nr:FAD-dependent oxidoreductase [Candidatus Omnitrophota bacterium]
MGRESDILIVGGGPAGVVAAFTAKKYYPQKKITVIKNVRNGVIPCGIPYMISDLKSPEDNKLNYSGLEKLGVEIITAEVVKLDRVSKKVITKSGDSFRYEKLVLAIGSRPVFPPISGIDLKNVFSIYKDLDYLNSMVGKIKESKNILIIGGGFIGIEFADEISNLCEKNVYIVEVLPHLLSNSFDPEFSELAEVRLGEKGVEVITNVRVERLEGENEVKRAYLSNGKVLDVDAVILGVGAVPNTELAVSAGLSLGKGKGIWVDEYMRTEDPDIFAVGDCAGKRDFFTRKDAPVLLASIATAEARIAGANLYQLKVVRENKGTIAIFSTYISGLVLGSAGLTENSAKKEGFEVIVGKYEGVDKHPGELPDTHKIRVKLVFSRQSGILMGGQVAGGISCGEIINIIGVAIQKRVSLTELETLQMATHPHLTPAPTTYHLVMAAQDALLNYGLCR